jgi:hypothetical protein
LKIRCNFVSTNKGTELFKLQKIKIMTTSELKTAQLLEASTLGTLAYNNGIKVPCQDSELLKMSAFKKKIGEKVKGEATSIDLMKAWQNAWHKSNLAYARAYLSKLK